MCARPSKAFLAAQRQVKRTARLTARLEALDGTLIEVKPGRRKFHNTRTVYNGMAFDSLGEAEYAKKLDLRCTAGDIADWERPRPVILQDGPRATKISYKPDFWILPVEGEHGYYLDYKGGHVTETPVFKLKVKLWRQAIPHELRIAYADGTEKTIATGNECFAYRDALARANVPATD